MDKAVRQTFFFVLKLKTLPNVHTRFNKNMYYDIGIMIKCIKIKSHFNGYNIMCIVVLSRYTYILYASLK